MSNNGTIKHAPQPRFAGMKSPSFDFDSLIDGIRCTPFIYELDLSTARDFAAGTAVQVKITGNCCLIDTAPDVGSARIVFEGVQDFTAGQVRAPIYCRPGFVTRLPFANLYIANHAQPGKKLRIIYGVDIDFQELSPSRIDAVEQGFDYTNTFASASNLGVGGTQEMIAAAANLNGCILWHGSMTSGAAGNRYYSWLAKATVPATQVDGDVYFSAVPNTFLNVTEVFARPVFMRPGLGLWAYNSISAETTAFRTVLYTLL